MRSDVDAAAMVEARGAMPCVRTFWARAWSSVRASWGRGMCCGFRRRSFETLEGCVEASVSAIKHPSPCAIIVAPDVMFAYSKIARRSAVSESMLSLLRGCVGDSPWPSRSYRWHVYALSSFAALIKGMKYSLEAPRPWTKMRGAASGEPRVR